MNDPYTQRGRYERTPLTTTRVSITATETRIEKTLRKLDEDRTLLAQLKEEEKTLERAGY